MTTASTAFTLGPLAWRSWLEPLDHASATPTSLLLAPENASWLAAAPGAPPPISGTVVALPRAPLVSAILDEPTGLPQAERELAAVVVSAINGCLYSAAFHGRRFVQLTQTPTIIERIFAEGVDTPLDPRPRAIVDYAVKLTLMPDRLLRADLAQLRAVGLSDLEVLDLTHVVALVAWLNRLCQTLGEPVATADEPTSLP